MSLPPLQMSSWTKALILERHAFLVVQIERRLLSLLTNEAILEEAKAYEGSDWESFCSSMFDEDVDPGDAAEMAIEKGAAQWELLHDLKTNVLLSLITGVFHNWEKELRSWLNLEVERWCRTKKIKSAIWTAKLDDVLNILKAYGLDVREAQYYKKLDAARLVVNVYKHGNGKSFELLTKKYPQHLKGSSNTVTDTLVDSGLIAGVWQDHTDLEISTADFIEFSAAISEFWQSFPDDLTFPEDNRVPKWFLEALSAT